VELENIKKKTDEDTKKYHQWEEKCEKAETEIIELKNKVKQLEVGIKDAEEAKFQAKHEVKEIMKKV